MNKTKWKQSAYHRNLWQLTPFPTDDWKWEKEKWTVKLKYKWMTELVGKEKKKEEFWNSETSGKLKSWLQ